jgi:shikimate kinase
MTQRHQNFNSLIFIGLMGCGKSSVGFKVSQQLQLPFSDIDDLIVNKHQKSIPEIFEEHGEVFFREQEHEVFKEKIQQIQQEMQYDSFSPHIISTGGGLAVQPQNLVFLQELIAKHAFKIVYFHTLPHVLAQRVYNDKNRPLLQQGNKSIVLEKMQTLYNQRHAVYNRLAHYTLDGSKYNVKQLADQVMGIL